MTRTERGSQARRARADRILDAAADLLLRHGYRRVSIDDVAAEAGVGKGTIYLHWKTREALFWAALQRETMRLLEDLVRRLGENPALALPDRLMPAIYADVSRKPLVRALLVNDAEILGALGADQEVAAAQREFAGNPDYLEMLAAHGLLRDDLTPAKAGRILGTGSGCRWPPTRCWERSHQTSREWATRCPGRCSAWASPSAPRYSARCSTVLTATAPRPLPGQASRPRVN